MEGESEQNSIFTNEKFAFKKVGTSGFSLPAFFGPRKSLDSVCSGKGFLKQEASFQAHLLG